MSRPPADPYWRFTVLGLKFRDKFTGFTVKVVNVEPSRVKLLHGDTGDLFWVDNAEFKARYSQVRKVAS
jgi:hypothetical protein